MKLSTESPNEKNWFGQTSHPTDVLISWRDYKWEPIEEKAKKLREAYETIKAAGLLDQANILIEAAYHIAKCDAADESAGEAL